MDRHESYLQNFKQRTSSIERDTLTLIFKLGTFSLPPSTLENPIPT